MRALLSSIEKLTAAIGDDGEYTVISQIKNIRLDLRDGNDKIIRELRDFGKTLAENNTKTFIEALNETMRDFNRKLTEQFGENFKQLNIAVGRLLDWQIHYQETIERVTKNLEITFTGIDAAKNSIAEIEKSSGVIKNSSEQILNLIVTANVYEKKLEQILLEVQNLGNSAQNAVPSIVNLVQNTCKEIQQFNDKVAQNINSTATRAGEMAAKIANLGNATFNRLEEISNQTVKSMLEISKRIESTSYKQREIMDAEVQSTKDAIQKAAAALGDDAFKITKDIESSLHHMMKINNENLQKSAENLSKDLKVKIEESVEKFGDALFLVSNRFVEDYTPLTKKLAALVHLAENIGGKSH